MLGARIQVDSWLLQDFDLKAWTGDWLFCWGANTGESYAQVDWWWLMDKCKKTNKPFTGIPWYTHFFLEPCPNSKDHRITFSTKFWFFFFQAFPSCLHFPACLSCMKKLRWPWTSSCNRWLCLHSGAWLPPWKQEISSHFGMLESSGMRSGIFLWRLEVGIFHRTITCGNSAGRTHGLKCFEDLWRWIGSPKIDASYIPSPSDAPNVDAQETVPL